MEFILMINKDEGVGVGLSLPHPGPVFLADASAKKHHNTG
jgi:hypothetical protein